jgi:membrane peptidoglycan carboxypeptidase
MPPGGRGPEGPTDVVRPVRESSVTPEPQLLTHREPDFESSLGLGTDYDQDSLDGDGFESDTEIARLRKKKIMRRVRQASYALLVLMIFGPIVAFFIAYQVVDVPSPTDAVAELNKTVTVQYADGREMTKIAPGNVNRTLVSYEQIPKHVLHAVYSAEDATFETNSGFDLLGIAGAVWNNLTGGSGGGSTITQQYVKQATGNDEKSLTRKGIEIVQAYKMNNTQNKDDIITAYLNTIYFGRGAYGIKAASEAYFNQPDLQQITPQQAALLAGMIQLPGRSSDIEYQQRRWNFVMDQMVNNNWLSRPERANSQFPTPVPPKDNSVAMSPTQRQIWAQVKREIESKGVDMDKVQQQGLTVQTTIDPKAQDLAEATVRQVMEGQPGNLRNALVAVDPETGGVIAYHGYHEAKPGVDYAQSWQNPGSSFKPFDLVALLQQGKGLGEVYDGSSPRQFGNKEIANSEGFNCEKCTVAEAMKKSINTVFADIALNTVGTKAVANAANQAGIPEKIGNNQRCLGGGNCAPPDVNIAIGGGLTEVRPIDMAAAYATFANNGTKHTPHFVKKVYDPESPDEPILPEDTNGTPAFDKNDPNHNTQIAGNVTASLVPVLEGNSTSGGLKCADNRACAGKTGTHQYTSPDGTKTSDNSKAWMVGYAPQISTAVWIGADGVEPIRNSKDKPIFGSGLPGEIWKKFMDAYLKGKERKSFPKVELIGKGADASDSSSSSRKPSSNGSQPGSASGTQNKPTSDSSKPPESSESKPSRTRPSNPFDPPTVGDGVGPDAGPGG